MDRCIETPCILKLVLSSLPLGFNLGLSSVQVKLNSPEESDCLDPQKRNKIN